MHFSFGTTRLSECRPWTRTRIDIYCTGEMHFGRTSERVYRCDSKFRIGVNKTKTYLIHYFDGVSSSFVFCCSFILRTHTLAMTTLSESFSIRFPPFAQLLLFVHFFTISIGMRTECARSPILMVFSKTKLSKLGQQESKGWGKDEGEAEELVCFLF